MSDSTVERAYAAAISRVVSPGDVVLDLGGGFGRRSVLACQRGAARVYCVQPAARADVARAVFGDNRCADRIEVLGDVPAAAPWLDAVTVVIAEDPGGLPLHGASLTRRRRRGQWPWPREASTIPRRETLRAAIVRAPALLARHLRPWEALGHRWDLSAARQMAQNVWSACALEASQVIAAPADWATVDYAQTSAAPASLRAVLEWSVESGGQGHGVAVWPRVELADGVVIENDPGTVAAAIGHAYFPWPESVTLAPGARVTVELRAQPLARGWESCLWNWTTAVDVGRSAQAGRRFVQSTFLGSLDLLGATALSAGTARAENT